MQDARTDAFEPAPAWQEAEEWYDDTLPPEARGVPTRPSLSGLYVVLGLLQLIFSTWVIFAPHRIVSPLYHVWRDMLWIGPVLVLAGGLLVWIGLLPVRRRPIVLAGLALTLFNYGLMAVLWWDGAEWFSALIAAVFAAVTLGALLLEVSYPDELPNWSFASLLDLAAMLAQATSIAVGATMVFLPALYSRRPYADLHNFLAVIGGALLVFGLLGFALGFTAGRLSAVRRLANALLAFVWLILAADFMWHGLTVRAFQAAALVLALLSARAVGLGEGRLAFPVTFAGNSARRRAALTITSVFFVAVVAVVAVGTRQQEAALTTQINEEVSALASNTANVVSRFVDSQSTGLDVMEDVIETTENFSSDETFAVLLNMAEGFPGFSYISVVDPNGKELVRTDDGLLQDLSADPVVALGSQQRERGIGQVVADPVTGEPVIHIVYGIFDEARQPLGAAIVGTMPVSVFGRLVAGEEMSVFAAEGDESSVRGRVRRSSSSTRAAA